MSFRYFRLLERMQQIDEALRLAERMRDSARLFRLRERKWALRRDLNRAMEPALAAG